MSSNPEIKTLSGKRFWELDFVRGISIFCMMIFHCIYQWYYVFGIINIDRDFFYYFPKLAAVFFILLGTSLYIGIERKFYKSFKDVLKRSLLILGCGMIITGATLVAQTGFYIYFGVLHCHGVSTFLSYFFSKLNKWWILVCALILISLEFILPTGNSLWTYCLFSSHLPAGFGSTFDYFPLIPNLGYALFGVFLGKQFYTNGIRQFNICKANSFVRFFCSIGKRTLLIYLIHVPILFLLNDLIMLFFRPDCFVNILDFIKF